MNTRNSPLRAQQASGSSTPSVRAANPISYLTPITLLQSSLTTPVNSIVSLFETKLIPSVRFHRGQTSGRQLQPVVINSSSLIDFKHQCWELFQIHLKREVFHSPNETPAFTWAPADEPGEDDLDRFLIFKEPVSKRTASLNEITTALLHFWKGKSVNALVCVYGSVVANGPTFKQLEKDLLELAQTDRSGAASMGAQNEMEMRLRETHRLHYVAMDINWSLWANQILAAEPHRQERMVVSAPPADIVHFFRSVQADQGVENERIRNSNRVALDENARLTERLDLMADGFSEIRRLIGDFGTRLTALQTETAAARRVMTSFELSLPPVETAASVRYRSDVVAQEDINHQE